MTYKGERDLAVCGLACVLCRDEDCPGCKARGCADTDCAVYQCATKRGLDGCYACAEFPCGEKMHGGARGRAFNQYARQFGKRALLERLEANHDAGIAYHRADGSAGDYDGLSTQEEVMRLIQFGRSDPYAECPVFETEHFALRRIEPRDAEDLRACYGDPEVRRVCNMDNCSQDAFAFTDETIGAWLEYGYATGELIRFSIVERHGGRAVGTLETYDGKAQKANRTTGMLRIDIARAYEAEGLLAELLRAADRIFFEVYHAERILTKAFPELTERAKALEACGYRPVEIEGRAFYWGKGRG